MFWKHFSSSKFYFLDQNFHEIHRASVSCGNTADTTVWASRVPVSGAALPIQQSATASEVQPLGAVEMVPQQKRAENTLAEAGI